MSKTVTISLDEETDMHLRRYAENRYGRRKGAIKMVIKEAMDSLLAKNEQQKIREEAIKLMTKGVRTRKSWKFNRDELYER